MKKPKMMGKSLWRGENGEELNVEMRALQYYENLGYKGFGFAASYIFTH